MGLKKEVQDQIKISAHSFASQLDLCEIGKRDGKFFIPVNVTLIFFRFCVAQMIDSKSLKPGPFQVIDGSDTSSVETPISPPRRRYDCKNYERCLDMAAALNWDSFTCRGCSSEIDETLLWRARQAQKRDQVAGSLCVIPQIRAVRSDEASVDNDPPGLLRIAGKR